MKIGLVFATLIAAVLVSCNKKEAPEEKPSNDSLLSRPLDPVKDPVITPQLDSFKSYIDPRRVRTPEHLAIIKRFTPVQVTAIYRDFRPLRKQGFQPGSPEVEKFLKDRSITLEELKAVLEEGDRLGWSKDR